MKNKITLLFAALMMTLGVCADDVVYNGRQYFDWPTTVVQKNEVTSEDQLATLDGKYIVIQHNHTAAGLTTPGSYLSMNSLIYDGNSFHTTYLSEECVGLSMFMLEKVEEEGVLKGYKLKTIHHNEDSHPCYLGQFGSTNLNTTNLENGEAALINFKYVEGKGFFITSKADKKNYWGTVTGSGYFYLSAENSAISASKETDANLTLPSNFDHIAAFNVYEVPENGTQGVTKFVENASVKLIGPAGNIVTTTHSGWSDFYEFVEHSESSTANYGVSLSNVLYHPTTNQITANIKYAFPVSGDVAKIPVHLCPMGNENLRISIVDGNLKVVEKPAEGWTKDKNNQWYIFPRYDNQDFTYAIKNVGTGQYINFTEGSRDITLSENSTYFALGANTAGTYLNFEFKYSSTYTYCLYGSNVEYVNSYDASKSIPAYKVHTFDKTTPNSGKNFLVPAVSAAELDGKPAVGFTRYFHEDTYFWDGGHVEYENLPEGVKGIFNNSRHEGILENGSVHNVYTAITGMEVTQTGSVVVQFDFIEGKNALLVLGVDVTSLDGTKVVSWDYHFGKVGTPSEDNLYILSNIEQGKYLLRYWVCNRTDLDGWDGHNLKNVRGKIQVKGANYNLLKSEAPSADAFHANTTWFRMRLCDGLEKYISAQPAYTDWHNNLKLSNNTPPSDYAGLWCIVGDEENGYKFYNRAWGPEYAMKTEGEEEGARTYMVPVVEASTYDIVQQEGNYQFFVKVHGEGDKFLNDRGGYLATWKTDAALGNSGSVMSFETVNMEGWEANTEVVENELKNLWAPWKNANTEWETAYETYTNNSTFASLVSERQQLAELLNGKVFKFANKGGDDRNGRILGIDENGTMLGMEPSQQEGGNINEFVQLNHNGDGTYNLLHLATNKYFDLPDDGKTAVADVNSAAKYSIANYAEDPTAALFAVSNTHLMNLGDGNTRSYKLTNYNGHPEDGASRWTVTFDADAQALAELIEEAKARYAETQEAAYQANVGVPGYANAGSTTALNTTINGGLAGKTFTQATTALTAAMDGVTAAEKTVFFPTNCYFTITNKEHSLVYAENNVIDETHNAEFIWTTENVDATNPNHLWGFYQDVVTDDYYLYNVGKVQFANSKGKGEYGDTWILSNNPVAITMEAMDTPYFHIKGDGKTMSVSTGYDGPVITYYAVGDQGVPMQFNKSTVTVDPNILEQLENLGTVEFAPGFYTLKYNDLYLNDTRLGGAGTAGDGRRTLTEMTADKIANIFYYTSDNEMVGYKSGYGFTYGYCNTGKPEDGYNTFTFETSSEPGKYLINSDNGNSTLNYGDRYLLVDGENQFTDDNAWNKKLAAAWTIEAVTELPVKLNKAADGYAYASLYTPVALTINDDVYAYTGVVSADGNYLQLTELSGVIPAGTGVVLKTKATAETGIYNFAITTSDATADANNVLKGDIFTTLNEATYYSLNNVDGIGFYKYTGANLSGFRARISGADADVTKLTFRFGNPTGIEGITSAPQNEVVYDLSGRRVATPKKGLYIVNGKKVFIK